MLSIEQWQWLWNQTKNATELNQLPIRDWLFELLTEHGFEVRDDVVVKLG